MEWMELLGIFIVAFLVGAVFFWGFSMKGPWGTFWPFLMILIGGIWFAAAISEPVGPILWDVAWVDFLVFGLIFALIMSATTPTNRDYQRYREYYSKSDVDSYGTAPGLAIGMWFWIMILLIIIAIIASTVS